jgi:5'-methylthioinosine phosphorylase
LANVAVIGGTGLNQFPELQRVAEHAISTPYGEISHAIIEGDMEQHRLFFLARHGQPHHLPPHLINYRANLWALKSLGISQIVAINAVGGIDPEMKPGLLVIPDQIIDYTWGREHTYADGSSESLMHIDFTEPYTVKLRLALVDAAADCGIPCRPEGIYAAMQGPRLESAAEVRRLHRDGCDIVGMTGMPEAALARELDLDYASICMVVNAAAGLSEIPLTVGAMEDILHSESLVIADLIRAFLQRTPA